MDNDLDNVVYLFRAIVRIGRYSPKLTLIWLVGMGLPFSSNMQWAAVTTHPWLDQAAAALVVTGAAQDLPGIFAGVRRLTAHNGRGVRHPLAVAHGDRYLGPTGA